MTTTLPCSSLTLRPVCSIPLTPAPWSLEQTLRTLRERRLVLTETSRGLRILHRHRHHLPGLDEALEAYASVLRIWLRLGGPTMQVQAPWTADGWDDATRLFAAWFGLYFEAPTTPVELRLGEMITDWALFRVSVAARLSAGPTGLSASRVSDDLQRLFIRFGLANTPAVERTWSMAA